MKPEISVIIPTYNRQDTISNAIESIVNQTFKNWELILIDDGSTDKTFDSVKPYLSDSRITYFKQENNGVCSARNSGAAKSESDWLIFLDSDDELTLEALGHFKDHIKANQQCSFFIAGHLRITKESRVTSFPIEGKYYPFLSGSFCLRKVIFSQVGGYDTRFLFAENTELFHRIRLKSNKYCFLERVSLLYYENQKGGSKNLENVIQSNLLFLEKHGDSLSNHMKFLNHQIIGVIQLRFQRFEQARKHLLKAYLIKPYQLKTLARLILSYIPILSKQIYTMR